MCHIFKVNLLCYNEVKICPTNISRIPAQSWMSCSRTKPRQIMAVGSRLARQSENRAEGDLMQTDRPNSKLLGREGGKGPLSFERTWVGQL
jgi:hypothetical protein